MPDPLIEKLQSLADKNDISFNNLVVQCCEYRNADFLFVLNVTKPNLFICSNSFDLPMYPLIA